MRCDRIRTYHPLTELWRYRHLLVSLTVRELRIRYKQSLLGIAWAVFVPLSMMLVFTFVFTRAVKIPGGLGIEMPYALFAYMGLVPWTFFAGGLNGCVNSLVGHQNLVTKVYFPREVLPLSCIASAFVDFVLASSVLVGLIGYFHLFTEWSFRPSTALLFLPVVVMAQIILMIGVGMILAMANLFYRDVRQIFSVLIQIWLFASNVVYPLKLDDSWIGRVVGLNPMIPIISAYRDCIVHGSLPDAAGFLFATMVAVAAMIVGWACFHRAGYLFAERI